MYMNMGTGHASHDITDHMSFLIRPLKHGSRSVMIMVQQNLNFQCGYSKQCLMADFKGFFFVILRMNETSNSTQSWHFTFKSSLWGIGYVCLSSTQSGSNSWPLDPLSTQESPDYLLCPSSNWQGYQGRGDCSGSWLYISWGWDTLNHTQPLPPPAPYPKEGNQHTSMTMIRGSMAPFVLNVTGTKLMASG